MPQPSRIIQLVIAVITCLSGADALGVEVSGVQNGVWLRAENPFIVVGDVIVPEGMSLRIEAGVVIKFDINTSLKVHGTLIAVGNSVERIVFTSINDNEFGHGGLSSTTLPGVRDWRALEFMSASGSSSHLDYCIIRYCDHVILAKFASPVLTNVIIADCRADHVLVYGQRLELEEGIQRNYHLPVTPAVISAGPAQEYAPPPEVVAVDEPASEEAGSQLARLSGVVLDRETGERLPGANIVVRAEATDTIVGGISADARGEFEITTLNSGRYDVTVSYIGYERAVIAGVAIDNGESTNLEALLTHTGIEFNPVVVTASRRPEKILDAPVAIAVLNSELISARTTLTVTDHVKTIAGVDHASSGINQSNLVVRGFNNVFSGALLLLTDNRIARVPSLQFNAYNLIPLTDDDLERIEIVAGPGSALYGPNSANGVMHLITKSPIGSEGTSVSVGGGERVGIVSTFRHANSIQNRVGYRFSGQYYRGRDWRFYDPAEPDSFNTANGRVASPGRDFEVEKFGGEFRLDVRPTDHLTVVFNAGIAQASDIELTGLGAAQARNWRSSYLQGRLFYKGFFAQAYLNQSDAGASFLLRTGDPIVDKSQLYVGQIQHNWSLGTWQRFTYGVDVLRTRPSTQGTINGRHEYYDRIDEIGAFFQSETAVSSKFDLHLAARVDDHNFIKDRQYSPRAALLFKPDLNQTLRLTFNRAFSTPSANNFFLDRLATSVPTATINPGLVPLIGPTLFNVYASGTAARRQGFEIAGTGGFTFRYDDAGRPMMISLFGPAIGAGNAYLPAEVNAVWPALRALVIASQTEEADRNALNAALPQQLRTRVPGIFKKLNPTTRGFEPVAGVSDIARTRPTITSTYEFGYKGLLGGKLLAGVDLYHSRVKDFIGPLIVETPHVFIDSDSLASVLTAALTASGFPESFTRSTVEQVTTKFASLPIGLVSPQQVRNATDVILTYRNFGDIALSGIDLSFTYFANTALSFSGSISYVDRNFFRKTASQPHDIALNAPKRKASLSVHFKPWGGKLNALAQARYVEGFPVSSGVYSGWIKNYTLLDCDIAYNLFSNTRLSLTVQNVFDNRHREMIGAPEIGRQAIARISQSL